MNKLLNTLLSAALVAGASCASAATVHVTFASDVFTGAGHDTATLAYPGPGGAGETSASVYAGRLQGSASELSGADAGVFVPDLSDLRMYCYDLYEYIWNGAQVTYTVHLDGAASRTLDFLGAVNAVLNAGRASFDAYAWLSPVDAAQSAAIQIGIWESLYDSSGWSVASGSFRAGGFGAATGDWLQQFFGAVDGSDALDGRYVMRLQADGFQDMITGQRPSEPQVLTTGEVPEPGSLALLGLGMAGLAGVRAARRRRR